MIRLDLLLLLVPLLLCQCSAVPPELGLRDGRLRPCPGSPNCLNSDQGSGASRTTPLFYTSSTGRAWERLKEAVIATGGQIIAEEEGYLRAVYTSPILRFKDDVEFRLDRDEPAIQLRSASRVGYWDLGANRRRVERIRKLFNEMETVGEKE